MLDRENTKDNPEAILKRIERMVDHEHGRRAMLSGWPVLIHVDGAPAAEMSNPQPLTLFLPADASFIEVIGRDSEGEIVIGAYQLPYNGSTIKNWRVPLPWNGDLNCAFEYGEDYVHATFNCTEIQVHRSDDPKSRARRVADSVIGAGWAKALLNFAGQALIATAVLVATWMYGSNQRLLINQQAVHEMEMADFRSFSQGIESDESAQRLQAIARFQTMSPRLAARLALVAATVDPIVATNRSVQIASDRSEDAQTRSAAELSRHQIMMHFKVTNPADDAEVSLREIVRGTTAFPGLRHYVVVGTPEGSEFVTSEARLSGDSWEGIARFGEAGAGRDQRFNVRVVATQSALTEGPFESPPDAMSSNSITVKRRP
jgi:hypothetical protein